MQIKSLYLFTLTLSLTTIFSSDTLGENYTAELHGEYQAFKAAGTYQKDFTQKSLAIQFLEDYLQRLISASSQTEKLKSKVRQLLGTGAGVGGIMQPGKIKGRNHFATEQEKIIQFQAAIIGALQHTPITLSDFLPTGVLFERLDKTSQQHLTTIFLVAKTMETLKVEAETKGASLTDLPKGVVLTLLRQTTTAHQSYAAIAGLMESVRDLVDKIFDTLKAIKANKPLLSFIEREIKKAGTAPTQTSAVSAQASDLSAPLAAGQPQPAKKTAPQKPAQTADDATPPPPLPVVDKARSALLDAIKQPPKLKKLEKVQEQHDDDEVVPRGAPTAAFKQKLLQQLAQKKPAKPLTLEEQLKEQQEADKSRALMVANLWGTAKKEADTLAESWHRFGLEIDQFVSQKERIGARLQKAIADLQEMQTINSQQYPEAVKRIQSIIDGLQQQAQGVLGKIPLQPKIDPLEFPRNRHAYVAGQDPASLHSKLQALTFPPEGVKKDVNAIEKVENEIAALWNREDDQRLLRREQIDEDRRILADSKLRLKENEEILRSSNHELESFIEKLKNSTREANSIIFEAKEAKRRGGAAPASPTGTTQSPGLSVRDRIRMFGGQ